MGAGIKTLILEGHFDSSIRAEYKVESFMDLASSVDVNNDIVTVLDIIDRSEADIVAGMQLEKNAYSIGSIIEAYLALGVYIDIYATDGNNAIQKIVEGQPYLVAAAIDYTQPAGWVDNLGKTGLATKIVDGTATGSFPVYAQPVAREHGQLVRVTYTISAPVIIDLPFYLIGVKGTLDDTGGNSYAASNINTVAAGVKQTYTSCRIVMQDDADANNSAYVGIALENYNDTVSDIVTIEDILFEDLSAPDFRFAVGHDYREGDHTPDTIDEHANHTISYNATTGRLEIAYTGAGTSYITWAKLWAGLTNSTTGQSFIKCDALAAGEIVGKAKLTLPSTYATWGTGTASSGFEVHADTTASGTTTTEDEFGIRVISPAGSGTISIERWMVLSNYAVVS